MTDPEPSGCLFALFKLFGITNLFSGLRAAGRPELPYLLRDDFLSSAELSFYRVLATAVGDNAVICPKVRLGDIFFVKLSEGQQAHTNRISAKHVDFLLCDPATMMPTCGIELDDSSHSRRDRQERDDFVDEVFRAAGLRLIRVPARRNYDPQALAAEIGPLLSGVGRAAPHVIVESSIEPVCPKCNVPMVQRTASKGQHKGQQFWGCANYPRCKATVRLQPDV